MIKRAIPEKPFTRDNLEATDEQIEKANEAYKIAAETWFDGIDPDDDRRLLERHRTLCDRIGNAFSDGLEAGEIATWATAK